MRLLMLVGGEEEGEGGMAPCRLIVALANDVWVLMTSSPTNEQKVYTLAWADYRLKKKEEDSRDTELEDVDRVVFVDDVRARSTQKSNSRHNKSRTR